MTEACRNRLRRAWGPCLGVLVATVALASSGCAPPPKKGWQRLWHAQWQQVHLGEHWQMGLPANGRLLEAERGQLVRASLLNPGTEPAEARLSGPGLERTWQVEPGAPLPIEIAIARRGKFAFSAGPELMLGSPRLGRPLAEPRLVVVVVVDTLRDDHVNPTLTPGILDAFSQGLRWRDVSANSSWTLPSMASLFTSRPVLDLTTPEGDLLGVPETLATWSGELESSGFMGAAVVANYTVHVHNGFGQGFATYLVPDGHGSADHPDASWVVAEAERWLALHAGEDAFLFLHLMDPHEPYRDHSGQGRQHPRLSPLAARTRPATAEESTLLRELYAGEVRHVDAVLTPFLNALPRQAVVAFTADHGELLGEHDCWGHGLTLFQETVAVPLLLKGPGLGQAQIATPVQLVDLAPTLLELAGCPLDEQLLGRSLLSGGSSLPAVSATFGAGPLRGAWRRDTHKVLLRLAPHPGLGPADRSHMVETDPLPSGAWVFDLAADPAEQQPLPLEGELLADAGNAFAATAGRMVPGLQVLLWGGQGPAELAIELEGAATVAQTWATAPVEMEIAGNQLRARCSDPFPVCGYAVTSDTPPLVRPAAGSAPWLDLDTGQRLPSESLTLPPHLLAGSASLWWNPPRNRTVEAHQETVAKLRALGYLR